MRNSIAFSILAAASMLPALSLAAACNGFDELCDKRYSNVTWVGSHNSAFVGVLPVHNQFVSPTKQLDMGVRFLQAQTHEKDGGIEMCHTDCVLLDAGSLEKYLREVAGWVKSSGHEREVVTLLLTNQDGIDVAKYAEIFKKVGLEDLVFTPGQGTGEGGILTMEEWPTLGEMLASGKRIVVFMDYHANTASVPYILDQFAYFFEGPYNTTDKNFPQCAIDRPSGASPDGRMYLVNHYLDIDLFGVLIPHVAEAPNTNSLNSILAQADLCMDTYNRGPNVMLLDWINVGDAMSAQEVLNNL